VNNHDSESMTNQLRLAQENQRQPSAEELPVPVPELIVQVDGGHTFLKSKISAAEALSAVIYQLDLY